MGQARALFVESTQSYTEGPLDVTAEERMLGDEGFVEFIARCGHAKYGSVGEMSLARQVAERVYLGRRESRSYA